jgi:hypothetical protein
MQGVHHGSDQPIRPGLKKNDEAEHVGENDQRGCSQSCECRDRDSNPDGVAPKGF